MTKFARALGPLFLIGCTVIWGGAFLAQKIGADHYGPFAITCYRNVLGALFLAGVLALRGGARQLRATRGELVGGSFAGVALFAAMTAQQIGIEETTPGVSAFLTANYVLLVPVFAFLVGRGKPPLGTYLGVALAILGSFLISIAKGSSLSHIGRGELWTLACAALFAIQIMIVDRYAARVNVIRFSMIQLLATAVIALPFVFLPSELARASWTGFVAGLPSLLFVGILSSGVAYTLQNLGQARTPPALAAIIMSMEGVFGTLFGWLFLGDAMTHRQLCGCCCVLAAVLLSQLIPNRAPKEMMK